MATADSAALDDFLNRFRTQVDSGFGLISGDVGIVFGFLVVISVAITALLWAIDETQNVTAAFIRKILLVGFFAWLIGNWHSLSVTIVEGFTALGLKAGSGSLSISDFMSSPSNIVADGFKDAFALIQYIGRLSQEGYGFGFFAHFDVILVAAVAAIGIILAFIILGVEVAVTIIEFHIVTLIAFVTVPFGILAQTAFMSERAIGYVVSVGVKLMTLALVVSIGESVFTTYVVSPDPTVPEECGLLLAAVVMLMLALKIPGIAGALISGGPQLSAGSAVAGAAALAAGAGGAALGARYTAAAVGRAGASLAGGGAAAKVGAANAAAGGASGGAGAGAGASGGASLGGSSGATDGGSSASAAGGAGPGGAADSDSAFARTLAQPAVNAAMRRALGTGGEEPGAPGAPSAQDEALQRALAQPTVNSAMRRALGTSEPASSASTPGDASGDVLGRALAQPAVNAAMRQALAMPSDGAENVGGNGPAEPAGAPEPPAVLAQPAVNRAMRAALNGPAPEPAAPSVQQTVAAARARGVPGGRVLATEGVRAAAQHHEEGGGAGMTPTLHAPAPDAG